MKWSIDSEVWQQIRLSAKNGIFFQHSNSVHKSVKVFAIQIFGWDQHTKTDKIPRSISQRKNRLIQKNSNVCIGCCYVHSPFSLGQQMAWASYIPGGHSLSLYSMSGSMKELLTGPAKTSRLCNWDQTIEDSAPPLSHRGSIARSRLHVRWPRRSKKSHHRAPWKWRISGRTHVCVPWTYRTCSCQVSIQVHFAFTPYTIG